MTESFKSVGCPNCGAPLDIPERHEKFFKCEFCGTTLEDKSSRKEWDTGVYKLDIAKEILTNVPTYRAVSPPVSVSIEPIQPSGSRVGCVIFLVVLLIGLAIIPVVFLTGGLSTGALGDLLEGIGLEDLLTDVEESIGGPVGDVIDPGELGGLDMWSVGPIRLVETDNDTRPDVVLVGSMSDSSKRMLYIDTDASPALRWMSAPLVDDASYTFNEYLVTGDRIFFAFTRTVLAMDRQTGDVLWTSPLSDEIQFTICTDCIRLFDGTLVALTADGVLQGIDAETGAARWNVRLNATPRQILDYAGQPAVPDEYEDGVGVRVLNADDGTDTLTFFTACPNEPFPSDPQTPGIYNPILTAPGGGPFYLVAGFFEPGCLVRYDPAPISAGAEPAPTWQATFFIEAIRGIGAEDVLLGDNDVFITNGRYISAVTAEGGAFRELLFDEDYQFAPLGERDGTLFLVATRTRGTRRLEIWAIDAQTGARKWTHVPAAANQYGNSSNVVRDEGLWSAGLSAEGLTLVQMFDSPRRMTVQTFSFEDGSSAGEQTMPLPSESGGFWGEFLGFRAREVWVLADSQIIAVEPGTGQELVIWP